METKILLPAILNSYRPLKDKSFSLNIIINEPSKEQKVIIDDLFQQAVYIMIKAGEINSEEKNIMNELEPVKDKKFSASQKLRFAIESKRQIDNPGANSEEYYQMKMSQIIDWINKK